MEEDEKRFPRTRQRFRDRTCTFLVACITAICMAFTIFFAYNSSLQQPYLSLFVSKTPQRSILILNIASHVTAYALAELTSAVLDTVRWSLACESSGTTALAFVTLSRATNFLGVLYLSLSRSQVPGRSSHRLWGVQRYIFGVQHNTDRILLNLLQFSLGWVLLSDVSFQRTYQTVHQFPVLQAGLSEMNSSLLQTQYFNFTATDIFWWYFPSILDDTKISTSVAPLSCSGNFCRSFYFPGPISTILFDPTLPNITSSEYSEATSYIQEDAPGYQLEFYPIDEADPVLTIDDCRVYGVSVFAFQICLKKTNSSLLVGIYISLRGLNLAWNPCPSAVAANNGCLNSTAWQHDVHSSTKMTIFKRRGSTVWNRSNFTVTDVVNLSDPSPVEYSPDDFFEFYDLILAVDPNTTEWLLTSQYALLLTTSAFVAYNGDYQIDSASYTRDFRLQEFLATPIAIFNNAFQRYRMPDGMGKSLTLVVPSYRVDTALEFANVVDNRPGYSIPVYDWWIDLAGMVLYRTGNDAG